MEEFSTWLKSQPGGDNKSLIRLQQLAGHLDNTPYARDLPGFAGLIGAMIKEEDGRSQLLAELNRQFARWSAARRHPPAKNALKLLLLALMVSMIIGLLSYGLFDQGFLDSLSRPKHARGMITFLFSLGTIAIFLIPAIAIYWHPAQKDDPRFGQIKELLTLIIGVFGSILGFYFGTAGEDDSGRLLLTHLQTTPNTVSVGGKITISASASGGSGPLAYDLYFSAPGSILPVSMLNISNLPVSSGRIDQPLAITIPPGDQAPAATDVLVTLILHDGKGEMTQASGRFTVTNSEKPKSENNK